MITRSDIPPLTETDREIMAFEQRILEFDLNPARRGTINDGTETWREMLDTFLYKASGEEVEPQHMIHTLILLQDVELRLR